MYREIGKVLSKYRSGKIPKAFKIVPKLMNWEQVVQYVNFAFIFCIFTLRLFDQYLNVIVKIVNPNWFQFDGPRWVVCRSNVSSN